MSRTQEQHPREIAGYVHSFTFSDGQVIASCKYPGCRWGIGHHDSDSLANKYFTKHCDNLAVDLNEVEPVDFEESEPVEVLALDAEMIPQAGDDPVVEVEDGDTGEVTVVLKSELEEQGTDGIGNPESQDSETGYREAM